jgi:hypothetical protein
LRRRIKMSVDMRHYVIIGYDLQSEVQKMDADQLDKFMEEMEELAKNKGLEFIHDGMSGEYCFLGKVLNKSEKYGGMPIKEHFHSDLDGIRNEFLVAVQGLKKVYQYPALYSFTHWY